MQNSTHNTDPASPRWECPLAVGVAFLALLARLIPGPRMIDDAFITFRYARNLVEGAGFIYNMGEAVLGTTTPLYTGLMALLSLVTRTQDFALLSLVINALADATSTLLLYHLGKRLSHSPWVGLAAALLWAIAPMSVSFAIGGMETSVFIVLMLGAFTAHLDRRDQASAVLSALALLTRPDAALIVALILGQILLENFQFPISNDQTKRTYLKIANWSLTFALVVAPWLLYATVTFGSPLPHSVAAKGLAYRLPPEAGLARFIQLFAVPFFESDVFDAGGLVRLMLYLTLYLAATLAALRRDTRSLPLLAYPLLYAAVFSIANPLIFRWYLAPPLPAYFLGLLLGLSQLSMINDQLPIVNWKLAIGNWKLIVGHWILGVVVIVFLITSLNAWTLRPDHGPARPAPKMAYIELELLYHQVADDLKSRVGPGTVIAAGDIGALGYDTGARILDTLGLVSPQTVRYYPLDPALYVGAYAVPPQLVLDAQPDWLVAPEVYVRKGLLLDPRFHARYSLYQKISTDIYTSDGLLVYQLKIAP